MSIPLEEVVSSPLTPASRTPVHHGTCIVRDRNQLRAWAEEWNTLAAALGPLEQFAWTQACSATLCPDEALRVVGVRECDRLVAAIAFRQRRRLGQMQLVQLGVDELYEPVDASYRDAAACAALATALIALRQPLRLPRFRADSPLPRALATAARGRAWLTLRPAPPAPYIGIDPSWQDAAAKLSGRRRGDLKRAWRRAQASGAVAVEFLTPDPTRAAGLFEPLLQIEARGWKGRQRSALMHDPLRRAFFRAYLIGAAATGSLRIARLKIGEAVAAFQIAAVAGGCYALLKIGYDEAYADCSPGQLLLQSSIEQAARLGLQRYDLLGLPAPWIAPWTRLQHECVQLDLYPRSLGGACSWAENLLRGAARRLVRR